MAKIKEGDLVIVKPSTIKWFLDVGWACFFRGHKFKYKQYEKNTLALLCLAIGPEIPVRVNKINWPGTDVENYNVQIFNIDENIECKGVRLWQK